MNNTEEANSNNHTDRSVHQPPKEGTMNNHDNELYPVWAISEELRETNPDLDYDERMSVAIAETALRQADDLHRIAEAIATTGIPIEPIRIHPNVRYSTDPVEVRRQAKIGIELMRACGVSINKIDSESMWGIEGRMPSNIKVEFSVYNETTCDRVPVMDDDGEPVMETVTVTKLVDVEETKAKTIKVCMPIFAADDAPADA